MKALDNEDSAPGAAGLLVNYGSDARTLPALESIFLTSLAKSAKQSVALSLLRLHVKDQKYFDYLASFAKEAVGCDAPAMFDRQVNGQKINSAFELWLLSRKLSLEDAARQLRDYARDMLPPVTAADERSAPIFREGLRSNIPEIAYLSISGLGTLGNPADIEPIIEIAERSVSDFGRVAAAVLASYKTPRDRDVIAERLRGSQLNGLYTRALTSAAVEEKGRQRVK